MDFGQGEASCNSTHGSNRLGANSTSECLVWGRITGKLAAQYASNKDSPSINGEQVHKEEKKNLRWNFPRERPG